MHRLPHSAARVRRAGLAVALVAGALAVHGVSPAMSAPGALAIDDPATLYDAPANVPLSSVAGETSYVLRGDLNGDGYPDAVNVTYRGAQVLLNQGTTGGVFSMAVAQEIPLPNSYGGGTIDADDDGDLDLVLGTLDHVAVVLNDGTGHFAVTKPIRHDFGMATSALPFFAKDCPGSPIRIAVCAAADQVSGDALGPNPAKLPYLYVLESDGLGGWSVLQRLDAMNCGGLAAGDWDGDGDADLLASSRSYEEPPFPAYAYESLDANWGVGFQILPGFSASAIGSYFAYRPKIRPDGDLVMGGWHRAAWFDRGFGDWNPPAVALIDPFGVGYATGECWANDLADIDGDGSDDMVMASRFSPVMLARLLGDPNAAPDRFTATAQPGTSTDLSAFDWDLDDFGAPDVVGCGSGGVFFYRNTNGGPAHSPFDPPLVPAHETLLEAYYRLTTLLDPGRMPPLDTIEARFYAALCQTYLDFMHPDYLTDGTLQGMTNAEKVAFLQSTYDTIHLCDYYLYIAKLWAAGEPDDQAEIIAIRGLLSDASLSLLDEAISLGGSLTTLPPNPTKAKSRDRSAKGIQKAFAQVLRDRDAARQMAALARITTDPRRQDLYARRTQDLADRAAQRLARIWYLNGY